MVGTLNEPLSNEMGEALKDMWTDNTGICMMSPRADKESIK
jgi:hypothetical protein